MTSVHAPTMMSHNASLRQEPALPSSSSSSASPCAITTSSSTPGHAVLVEGKLLQGDALLEYARQRGLCPKCVQHVTHQRVRKRLGMLRYTLNWIPLTLKDEQAGNYTVYKGYCLQPTCFTLQEVQQKLGERPLVRTGSRGRLVKHRKSKSSGSGTSTTRGTVGTTNTEAGGGANGKRNLNVDSAHTRVSNNSGDSSEVGDSSHRDMDDGFWEQLNDDVNFSNSDIEDELAGQLQQMRSTTRSDSRGRDNDRSRTPTTINQPHLARQGSGERIQGRADVQLVCQVSGERARGRNDLQLIRQGSGERVPGRDDLQLVRQTSGERTVANEVPSQPEQLRDSDRQSELSHQSVRQRVMQISQQLQQQQDRGIPHQGSRQRVQQQQQQQQLQQDIQNQHNPQQFELQHASSAPRLNDSRRSNPYANTPISPASLSGGSTRDITEHVNRRLSHGNTMRASAQISNRKIISAGISPGTPQGTKKQLVPDKDIMQQLYRLNSKNKNAGSRKGSGGALAIASAKSLWAILHKRYSAATLESSECLDSDPSTRSGRIALLLNILRNDDDSCRSLAWTLMGQLTRKQENDAVSSNLGEASQVSDHELNGRLVETILVEIAHEFHRDDESDSNLVHGDERSNVKRAAAQTLFHLLKAEENSIDSPVLTSLQNMTPATRHHWVTVLLDMLLFHGDDEDHVQLSANEDIHVEEHAVGTAESLFVVWNLLLSEPHTSAVESQCPEETLLVMKTIVGIAVSILSSSSTNAQDDCLYSNSERGGQVLSVLQAEASLGLLATVAYRWGAQALAGRQHECLRTITDTVWRFDDHADVLLQGSHSMCHIMSTFVWYRGPVDFALHESNEGADAPSNLLSAEYVMDVLFMILVFQDRRVSMSMDRIEELDQAACRLHTVLLESSNDMQAFVVAALRPRGSELVQSLLAMLQTTLMIVVSEQSSDILVYLLSRPDFAAHLRSIPEIASIMVHLFDRYRGAAFVQENLCHMVEHLVSMEDHLFGQEIGKSGGVNVLADILLRKEQVPSTIEAALRALIGVVSSIDVDLLLTYQVSLMEVLITVMENHRGILPVQVAALDALHSLCVRAEGRNPVSHRVLQNVIKTIVDYTSIHTGVLTQCSVILRVLARVVDENGSLFMFESGSVKVLINAMIVHPNNTEFVLEAMTTIKDFTAEASFHDFNYAEAQDCLVSILDENHTSSVEVVALALAALNNVLVDFHNRTVAPLEAAVLHHILTAFKTYPNDEQVWTNACLLLKSLTYSDENLALLQNKYSDEIIPLMIDSERLLTGEALQRARYIIRKLQ